MSSDTFGEHLEYLEIPANIDPVLLSLWLERERNIRKKAEEKNRKTLPSYGQKLNVICAAVIGIGAMCLSIILGLMRFQEIDAVLKNTCITFLLYSVGGFIFGTILEYCVSGSAETVLREIVKRTDENAAATK